MVWDGPNRCRSLGDRMVNGRVSRAEQLSGACCGPRRDFSALAHGRLGLARSMTLQLTRGGGRPGSWGRSVASRIRHPERDEPICAAKPGINCSRDFAVNQREVSTCQPTRGYSVSCEMAAAGRQCATHVAGDAEAILSRRSGASNHRRRGDQNGSAVN